MDCDHGINSCPLCHGVRPFDMRHMGILASTCPRCKGTGRRPRETEQAGKVETVTAGQEENRP